MQIANSIDIVVICMICLLWSLVWAQSCRLLVLQIGSPRRFSLDGVYKAAYVIDSEVAH